MLCQAFGFDLGEYQNVSDWLERIQTSAPGYEKANGEPVKIFKQIVQGNTEEGEGEGGKEGGEEEGEGGEGEGEEDE